MVGIRYLVLRNGWFRCYGGTNEKSTPQRFNGPLEGIFGQGLLKIGFPWVDLHTFFLVFFLKRAFGFIIISAALFW